MAGVQWLALKLDGFDGPACLVGEHQPLRSDAATLLELGGEQISEEQGQGDPTPTGGGLGGLADPLAFDQDELLDDGDGRRGQVDVGAQEADQLPPAHARVGRGVDERAELRGHGFGDAADLLGVEEPHLRGADLGSAEACAG